MTNNADAQQLRLEAFHFYVKNAINAQELLTDPQMHVMSVAENMVLSLVDTIYGQASGIFELSMPADWCQHFKQRWFPAWALRRWPVVEIVKTVAPARLWPGIKPPNNRPYVDVFLTDRTVLRRGSEDIEDISE